MALLCRIKQVRLNYMSQHLRICYFQTSVPQKAPYYYHHRHHHTINQAIHQRPSDFFRQTVRFFAAPVQVKKKEEVKGASGVKLNEQIKAEFVRLVGDEGHSIVARHEALRRAKNLKLDLVEVDRHAKPPVCKIMDHHKERYKQQVKEKERTKVKSEGSIKKGDCKEVRFSAKTELKDLKMKADTVKRMMERGYRVKCMAMGTEDQDLGGLLSQISAMIEDVAIVDSGPRVERKQAYVIVRHVKFGPSKKGGKKAPKGDGDTSSEFQKAANACSQSPIDLEEESSSEEYATGNDETDTPLQGQQQSAWSVSDANHAAFDKMFDLSHDMTRTSSSSSTEKHMKLAPSAVNSKAAGFSPSRVPNFKDPSQLEAENRYARNMTKNAPAARNPLRLPNYGNQPQSHSNFHPPGIEGSVRNLRVPQNDIPRDRVGIPNQPSQFEPLSNLSAPVRQSEPPNSRSSTSQSSGFDIFNATEVDAPGKYGAGVGVNQHCSGSPSNVKRNLGPDNLNSPTVKSDGCQRSGNDDSEKWGFFSRENPNPIPGRSIQGEGKVQ